MNGASRLLARYCRDLLGQPEGSVVILGRVNIPRGDTAALQIVIDQLAQATPLTDSQNYDGVAESMHVNQLWQAPMTIDFMGAQGYNEAIRFITLNRHQKGYDLKQALGIDTHLVSGLQDLKMLQGEQYSERYQLELTLMFNISANIETLRIDHAQLSEFLVN